MKAARIARGAAIAAGLAVAFGLGLCVNAPAPEGDTAVAHDDDAHDGAAEAWTCPMHPQVRADGPGACPYCGMDLVRADADDGADPRRIKLSERAKILARVETTPVRPLVGDTAELRLLGRVDYDETRVKTVTAWTNGRIDRLHAAATGQRLGRGQVIATLYSPEIYAAHGDLLSAVRQLERLSGATEAAQSAARAALGAASQRLRLLGVGDAQLEEMKRADRPTEHIRIRTPFAGTVIERLVDEGNYVQAGTGLYRLADLSRLWIQLDAYESDLPHLKEGQVVAFDVAGVPGKRISGKVAFIDPVIDPRTRTAQVRVEVDNADGVLRPGMYAEALVQSRAGVRAGERDAPLVVPDTAPLFTGRRSIVYVEVPDDDDRLTYEAREVVLGPASGSVYPVLAGLDLGERVVTRGAFVIDADLQIRGGESMMTRVDDVHRRSSEPVADVPAELTKHLAHIVRSYLGVQEALAADDLAAARSAAEHLVEAVQMARDAVPGRLRQAWAPLAASLDSYGRHFRTVPSLGRARLDFEAMSADILTLVQRFGNPLDEPLARAYCPMASDDRGATWVQRPGELRNPYFGAEMLTCGEVQGRVEPGAHLPLTNAAGTDRPTGAGASGGGHAH